MVELQFERSSYGTIYKKQIENQVPVAHACNPSYPEGTDQKDRGLKPAQANSS
jgi:hypothetical protein